MKKMRKKIPKNRKGCWGCKLCDVTKCKPDTCGCHLTDNFTHKGNYMGLKDLVDDSTTHVTIPTPKNWKCKRDNCSTLFKHTHGTYPSL